jgi:hypothetical protein
MLLLIVLLRVLVVFLMVISLLTVMKTHRLTKRVRALRLAELFMQTRLACPLVHPHLQAFACTEPMGWEVATVGMTV